MKTAAEKTGKGEKRPGKKSNGGKTLQMKQGESESCPGEKMKTEIQGLKAEGKCQLNEGMKNDKP